MDFLLVGTLQDYSFVQKNSPTIHKIIQNYCFVVYSVEFQFISGYIICMHSWCCCELVCSYYNYKVNGLLLFVKTIVLWLKELPISVKKNRAQITPKL